MQGETRLSKNQVTEILNSAIPDERVEEVMYRRIDTDGNGYELCIPTREDTDRIHRQWYRRQPATGNFGLQHVLFLRGTTVSGMAIRRKLSTYMTSHNTRFKFRAQTCFRIFKQTEENGTLVNCWRIMYPSQNQTVDYVSEFQTIGGWFHVFSPDAAQDARLTVHQHDYTVRTLDTDTTWNVGATPYLSYVIEVINLPGNRIDFCMALPPIYIGVKPFTGFRDNMCFWRCVAWNLDSKKFKSKLKWAFKKCYKIKRELLKRMDSYEGLDFPYELERFQKEFKTAVFIYVPKEKNGFIVPEQIFPVDVPSKHRHKLYLAKYNKHFSLITDSNKFSRCYSCTRCGKLCSTQKKHTDHQRTCKGGQALYYGKIRLTKKKENYAVLSVVPKATSKSPKIWRVLRHVCLGP